jgi:N-acetylmuramic acid 6-phosphate etherase
MVIGLMAGGPSAMYQAKEGIEDKKEEGVNDLKSNHLTSKDVVVGIAASGRTPYVIGALEYAQTQKATTIALSCNPQAEITRYADIALLPIVGAEALTGSTRMKSGSAQKMVLNMLSTASMIKIGKSYQNLMVDLKATNDKLKARSIKMLMQITALSEEKANNLLNEADGLLKLALLMALTGQSKKTAQNNLMDAKGFLRQAIQKNKQV